MAMVLTRKLKFDELVIVMGGVFMFTIRGNRVVNTSSVIFAHQLACSLMIYSKNPTVLFCPYRMLWHLLTMASCITNFLLNKTKKPNPISIRIVAVEEPSGVDIIKHFKNLLMWMESPLRRKMVHGIFIQNDLNTR